MSYSTQSGIDCGSRIHSRLLRSSHTERIKDIWYPGNLSASSSKGKDLGLALTEEERRLAEVEP